MFPNVRLMIVAVLGSIMGISCALGLFAEFRISRDSFLRESSAAAPLQLSAGGPAATLISTAATFGVRFAAQPSLPVPAATGAANPQRFDRTAANDPAPPVSLTRQEPQPMAAPASSTPMTAPETTATSSPASAPAANPSQDDGLGSQQNPQANSADQLAAKSSDQAADRPAEKPAESLADRTPAASPEKPAVPSRTAPEVKITPQRAPDAAAKRHITVRHRPLIARRVPRPRPVAPAQTTYTAPQPIYQWAAPGLPAQPVRRRVIVKRTSAVREPEQPTQASPGTSAAYAPL